MPELPALFSSRRRVVGALVVVIVFASALRLWNIGVPFFDDEPDWIRHSLRISITSDRVHLPAHGSNHGPFAATLLAASAKVFGTSPAGWRGLNVLVSGLLCVLVFAFARLALPRFESLVVTLLAAGNTVLLYYSVYAVQSNWFILFSVATLFFLLRAHGTGRRRDLFLAAGFLGLNGLTYLGAVFLVPGVGAFYLLYLRQRFRWRDALAAVGVAAAVTAPYFIWILTSDLLPLQKHSKFFDPILYSLAIPDVFVGTIRDGACLGFDSLDLMTAGALAVTTVAALVRPRAPLPGLMFLSLLSLYLSSLVFGHADPRHFSLQVAVICILLVPSGIAVLAPWPKVRVALLALFALGGVANGIWFVGAVPGIYADRTTFDLERIGGRGEISMDALARNIGAKVIPFKPTLVVMPDGRLDSTANYLSANIGVPSIDFQPENKALPVWPEERLRVSTVAFDGEQAEFSFRWAKNAGARDVRRREVPLGPRDGAIGYPTMLIVEAVFAEPPPDEVWRTLPALAPE